MDILTLLVSPTAEHYQKWRSLQYKAHTTIFVTDGPIHLYLQMFILMTEEAGVFKLQIFFQHIHKMGIFQASKTCYWAAKLVLRDCSNSLEPLLSVPQQIQSDSSYIICIFSMCPKALQTEEAHGVDPTLQVCMKPTALLSRAACPLQPCGHPAVLQGQTSLQPHWRTQLPWTSVRCFQYATDEQIWAAFEMLIDLSKLVL